MFAASSEKSNELDRPASRFHFQLRNGNQFLSKDFQLHLVFDCELRGYFPNCPIPWRNDAERRISRVVKVLEH